jgi:hypothetical protein
MQKLNQEAGSRCLLCRHDRVTSLATTILQPMTIKIEWIRKMNKTSRCWLLKYVWYRGVFFYPSCYFLLGGLMSRDWKIYGPRFEAQSAVFCCTLPNLCNGMHRRSSHTGTKSQVVAVLHSYIRFPSIGTAAIIMVSAMSQSDESCQDFGRWNWTGTRNSHFHFQTWNIVIGILLSSSKGQSQRNQQCNFDYGSVCFCVITE